MIDGAEEYRADGYNYNVLIYISPLIAGTNRKAYLLHASFALKDSHCQWSSITDFSVVQQLMPEHLHTYELS